MGRSVGYSISAAQGNIAPEHDRREYEPGNADARLSANNNVIIDTLDERTAFNELFADSIEAYNAGQKRDDRKKSFDYLSEIENGKGAEKPFYEYVFQIGNREDNGVTTAGFDAEKWSKDKKNYDIKRFMNMDADRLKLKKVLDGEMALLQERYPAFRFWSVIGHDDEPNGTYHYHVRFTPVGKGYKNGMEKRCSLTKALNNMGYYSDGGNLAIMQWQNAVKDGIETAMENAGYHRQYMSDKEKHASVSVFKLKKEKEKLSAEKESAIDSIITMYEEMQAEDYLREQERNEEDAQLQIERHEIAKEQASIKEQQENLRTFLNDFQTLEKNFKDEKKNFEAEKQAYVHELDEKHKTLDNLIILTKSALNEAQGMSKTDDNNPLGRKAFMMAHTYKSGTSLEEKYQEWAKEKKEQRIKDIELELNTRKSIAEDVRKSVEVPKPVKKLEAPKPMKEPETPKPEAAESKSGFFESISKGESGSGLFSGISKSVKSNANSGTAYTKSGKIDISKLPPAARKAVATAEYIEEQEKQKEREEAQYGG